MITLTVISPPIISNIIVTEDSLTVTWNNLVLPHNTIATCLIYVMQSFHGASWMTSSNTSNEDSITCSIAGLKSSTLYRIQYVLRIHKNYANGTIYIGTSAKVNRTGASSNHSTCDTGKAGNISYGVSSTIFAAVIAVAIVVIVLLILVIVWMRFQGLFDGCYEQKFSIVFDKSKKEGKNAQQAIKQKD
ncbi:uncharacterized protein LOC116308648 [Actinia tenebrosa]|uniref:Uncharacterized protein LOC116308648 n=1 Tax=Actinia tenebrosa TaxID=6105 RepID=A0A6P8JBB6_ACTTE|nr:uncharacterized protein LOC116308648 [Actinia tenebrosa]